MLYIYIYIYIYIYYQMFSDVTMFCQITHQYLQTTEMYCFKTRNQFNKPRTALFDLCPQDQYRISCHMLIAVNIAVQSSTVQICTTRCRYTNTKASNVKQ